MTITTPRSLTIPRVHAVSRVIAITLRNYRWAGESIPVLGYLCFCNTCDKRAEKEKGRDVLLGSLESLELTYWENVGMTMQRCRHKFGSFRTMIR